MLCDKNFSRLYGAKGTERIGNLLSQVGTE